MHLSWPHKDPDEVLDYVVDWADRLNGDSIETSVWEFVAGDGMLVVDSDESTGTTTTVWLSAGTIGETYQIRNRIVTTADRTMDQTVKLKIKAK